MLKLDLQFFGAEDEQSLDEMLEEFEAEWNEGESEEVATETETVEEETTVTPESEEVAETPEAPQTQVPEEESKRNQAFAELRRQAEEGRKYADFISRLAAESGVTPEDILKRYEDRQLEAKAEKEGVPVDVLKRLNTLEQENNQSKEALRSERLDAQIQSVVAEYKASDDEIRDTFAYMMQAGIDPRTADNVDFKKFYQAANLDSILAKKVEETRQADLEDKKKRQESASIPNGTSVSQNSGDLSDEEVDRILAQMDIRI